MFRSRAFAFLLACSASLGAWADITIKSNIQSGQTISGSVDFVLTVDAGDVLVTQVEFNVGGELRGTDNSTPYEFQLDTLNEKEGPLDITFTAYDSEGHKKALPLKLTIDNQLNKGAAFYIEQGHAALNNAKWNDALDAGRKALKIDANNIGALNVMARANLGKGILDAAQTFAEQSVNRDKENTEALDLLAAINLKKVFKATSGASQDEMLRLMDKGLRDAAEAKAKVYDLQLSKLDPKSQLVKYADVAIRAGRYSLVLGALDSAFRADETNAAVANRLTYAQIRAGKFRDAERTMRDFFKRGKPDAYSFALNAILAARRGDDATSTEMERQAILTDATSLGVRTAQAYLALYRNRAADLAKIATDLRKDNAQRGEVIYYLTAVQDQAGEYEDSRRSFEEAMLAEPANVDMLIQRANQAIRFSLEKDQDQKALDYQRKSARVFFQAALAAKPESFEALTGIALLSVTENKPSEAASYAKAATVAGPEYIPAWQMVALTQQFEAQRLNRLAEDEELSAARADSSNLREDAAKYRENARKYREGARTAARAQEDAVAMIGKLDERMRNAPIPFPKEAWQYFNRYGRAPLLASPDN